MDYFNQIQKFLEQAKTNKLGTLEFQKEFMGLKVKVSFGQGRLAKVPWIAFLKAPNEIQQGIYPLYLYFKDKNSLILAYGVSENSEPVKQWQIQNPVRLSEYFSKMNYGSVPRYGNVYFFKDYKIDSLDMNKINSDLAEIVGTYNDH
ncbi:hypothetical protein BH09BAC3_BH09BAC3_29980 [soil metagenome]